MSSTAYELHGAVAVITLANPPVNSLGYDLRASIVADVDRANADPAVSAIVLAGSARAFSGGADIREFDSRKWMLEPTLPTVIRVLEDSRKPVVAAIGGVCMGGGLELALAAHFRVATPDASIALPEVKLGLIPGAGGTQRLPRLIGIEAAANFIVAGNPVPAETFRGTLLFDELIAGDLRAGALAFATKVVAERRPHRRVRDLSVDYPNHQAYFQFLRNSVRAMAGHFPAPLKCLDALHAAVVKSFDEGIAIEGRVIGELIVSPESRALRHAFEAERAATKIPDVPVETPTRRIDRVGIVGAGTMGGGICMSFIDAGIPVVLLETNQATLDKGIGAIRKNYEGGLRKGKLTPQALEERMALVTGTLAFPDLKSCDLVIEAVFEDIAAKEAVFKELDRVAKRGAILATNTSTLDVDQIADFTTRPQDVVGMHFFSPANVMKLLEVVRGAATARDVLATVMRLAKRIRKTAVVAGACDGFIGNRMIGKYCHMADSLMIAGATPWQIDRTLEKWGMAMGPFRMADLAGNDIGWAIRKRRYHDHPPTVPNLADRLCELGRFGQKVGQGWYLYQPGNRSAIPDPVIERMLEDYRRELGVTPRPIPEEEIIQRCIYALVNEGARILDEGIAARASDIDMVYLAGYGFPAHRGGPMFYADLIGLYNVARSMRAFAAEGDGFWQPARLIDKLVAAGAFLT